jgi:hypothetical protein
MPCCHSSAFHETTGVERRARVAALYLEGCTQTEISRIVGVNQATVSRDLALARREWRTNVLRDFTERQAEELAKLALLEAEAWSAWERSKRSVETLTSARGRPMQAAIN